MGGGGGIRAQCGMIWHNNRRETSTFLLKHNSLKCLFFLNTPILIHSAQSYLKNLYISGAGRGDGSGKFNSILRIKCWLSADDRRRQSVTKSLLAS